MQTQEHTGTGFHARTLRHIFTRNKTQNTHAHTPTHTPTHTHTHTNTHTRLSPQTHRPGHTRATLTGSPEINGPAHNTHANTHTHRQTQRRTCMHTPTRTSGPDGTCISLSCFLNKQPNAWLCHATLISSPFPGYTSQTV